MSFGELELALSLGFSENSQPPLFCSPSSFFYISGNTIDQIQIHQASASHRQHQQAFHTEFAAAAAAAAATSAGAASHGGALSGSESQGAPSASASSTAERERPERIATAAISEPDEATIFAHAPLLAISSGTVSANLGANCDNITAMAFNHRDSVLAYSHSNSGQIIIKGTSPQNSGILKVLKDHKDLSINCMSFSPDGRYLVTCGSLPSHTVAVWNWKNNLAMLCSATCESAYNGEMEIIKQTVEQLELNQLDLISARLDKLEDHEGVSKTSLQFNPLNPKQFCILDRLGKISFWTICEGYKKHYLVVKNGSLAGQIEDFQWTVRGTVYATTLTGEVVQYDPASGDFTYILLNQSVGNSMQINKASFPSEGNLKCLIVSSEHLIVAGQDGVIRYLPHGAENMPSKEIQIEAIVSIQENISPENVSKNHQFSIENMVVSPDYRRVLLRTSNGRIFSLDLANNELETLIVGPPAKLTNIVHLPYSRRHVITGDANGSIIGWSLDSHKIICKVDLGLHVPLSISKLAVSPLENLLVVGDSKGGIWLFDLTNIRSPRCVFRKTLFKSAVREIEFEQTGRLLAVMGETDGVIYLISLLERLFTVGWIKVSGKTAGLAWGSPTEENPDNALVALTNEGKKSRFYRFLLSAEEALEEMGEISYEKLQAVVAVIDSVTTGIILVPSAFSGGRDLFYTHGEDKKLRAYVYPVKSVNYDDQIREAICTLVAEYPGHSINGGGLLLSGNQEWVISWSSDGNLMISSLLETDKIIAVAAHDPNQGGISGVSSSRDGTVICTVGDGILRIWSWRYSSQGKKNALHAMAEAENQFSDFFELREQMKYSLDQLETLSFSEISWLEESDAVKDERTTIGEQSDGIAKEREAIEKRIASIRQRLQATIKNNEDLPPAEQIGRDEFIIDFAEKERLMNEAESKVQRIRALIEVENWKKSLIRSRIKKECWDSMEVVGKAIKSFNPAAHSEKLMEIPNYPLRQQDPEELRQIEKVKTLRKVEIAVLNATKTKRKEEEEPAALNTPPPEESEEYDSAPKGATESLSIAKGLEVLEMTQFKGNDAMTNNYLLYDPFELTTAERKAAQILLLKAAIRDIKCEFNKRFEELANLKRDEISKIEDKNERIKEIVAELALNEEVFHPKLDDEEMPERIIVVRDEEIKSEKVMAPEEQRAFEEARMAAEEKRRLNNGDDSRERALQVMMGGKLEDRSEAEVKEELVKPEWMNKPKTEMTEDELKQVKEYEKKEAIFKEEQEKQRKALETELKKLQSNILEICSNFDSKLQELFANKLATDQLLFKQELKMIKLAQATMHKRKDESQEVQLLTRLEDLRQEKMKCVQETSEMKRDLDRCREEYEQAVKRDKELDRIFKKEFHGYEYYYETLLKLFKMRKPNTDGKDNESASTQNLNPFLPIFQNGAANTASGNNVQTLVNPFVPELDPPPLNPETDMPDGLDQEVWQKLVDLRDKKIAAENEVRQTAAVFAEIQLHVVVVLEESEKIRSETESVTKEINNFLQYRFHATYDIESLFDLKQGQVEVPQAPVVTDYSDAILIHRSAVEKLNENIVSLGQSKVEALKEIKDYRKGIHAIEWETKRLDFQAEDHVTKIRDIQLLRVTKQMQELIRGGDDKRQTTEVATLERRLEHSVKAHQHKIDEKSRQLRKIQAKIKEKKDKNDELDEGLEHLNNTVQERNTIREVQALHASEHGPDRRLREIAWRRKLMDQSAAQQEEIAILRAEVERLRLRTFPAFPTE